MKKVDIFFIALLAFGLIAMFRAEFLDVSGNVVNACIDSDNGIEPFFGGNLIGYDEIAKKDTCVNGTTLYEYYCVGDRSNGLVQEVNCENGCGTKNGKGVCLEEGEIILGEPNFGKCTDGCYFDGVCLPIGTRIKDGTYCEISKELEIQLFDEDECFNSFECRSNLCVAGNCVSEEIFDKFLESLNA